MRRKVSNLSPLQYLVRIFSASFLQNMVENQERKKRMSIRLTAVFPGEDAADLAVLSLRGKGCEVISQETQQRLRPGVSNEVASSRFWDFSPIPMQDGGTLFSMRLPGMPRVIAAARAFYRWCFVHGKAEIRDVGYIQLKSAIAGKEKENDGGRALLNELKKAHKALGAAILPRAYAYGFIPADAEYFKEGE